MNGGHLSRLLEPQPGDVCPTCDQRLPVPHETKTPRRRSQVNITVPADIEDGEEILRTLIEEARKVLGESLGYGAGTPPYYTIVAVFHDWLTHL